MKRKIVAVLFGLALLVLNVVPSFAGCYVFMLNLLSPNTQPPGPLEEIQNPPPTQGHRPFKRGPGRAENCRPPPRIPAPPCLFPLVGGQPG